MKTFLAILFTLSVHSEIICLAKNNNDYFERFEINHKKSNKYEISIINGELNLEKYLVNYVWDKRAQLEIFKNSDVILKTNRLYQNSIANGQIEFVRLKQKYYVVCKKY